jgi:4-alpha-glucanotransferase
MTQQRFSGVLLHPTSLPGPHGIGDLGRSAHQFVDFLADAKQSLWQVLPLGPTGYGDSPYASFSSHAGNPLLIDLEALVEDGDLEAEDLIPLSSLPLDSIDYGAVIPAKMRLLQRASVRYQRHASRSRRQAFERFCSEKSHWLDDYALFMALKQAHDGAMWNKWELDLVQRKPSAVNRWSSQLADEIYFHKYVQFQFSVQWSALRHYANEQGIRMLGDIPIFVAEDSADVWSRPDVFHVDRQGRLSVVAGVPPDYFSPTGQRWGNPLYRWDVIAADGFKWWIERIQSALEWVDALRIDHFRGFQDYWEIPAKEPTAVKGRWMPGPGDAFFDALRSALGNDLPIIAEDLGMITDEVHALRQRTGLPGMKVLHFAFGGDPDHEYLPHNHTPDCVVYLGTHDNDTTVGWFDSLSPLERKFCLRYLGRDGHDIAWAMMHVAFMSVGRVVIVTAQDLLKLGSAARMNTPGVPSGNWQWRYRPGAHDEGIARWLGELTETFARAPEPVEEEPETSLTEEQE